MEIYSIIMTVTKKSIKITEKHTNEAIGTNDSLTHFNYGTGEFKYLYNFSQGDKFLKDTEAKREEFKKQYGIKRTNKICQISECNDFKSMVTLTFSPEDNQTEEQVKENWALAKKRLEFRHGKFKYICALERGSKEYTNHLHLHIITDIEYINNHSKYWQDKKTGIKKINKNWLDSQDDILHLINTTSNRSKALKNKRIEMFNDGASYLKVLLGFGHVHVKAINEDDVKYICKYISKDTDLNEKYKRTIWTSRNLEQPIKIYSEDVIEYLLENKPTDKYEYKETICLFGNEDYACTTINTTTLKYQDIQKYYYMCKTAFTGNEIYLKEIQHVNNKSYNYMFNLLNPKKDKDFNYYEGLYGEYKKTKYKKECVF